MTSPNDTAPLTDQQLNDIETRANAATPGDWLAVELPANEHHKHPAHWVEAEYTEGDVTVSEVVAACPWRQADAEFVAHAREDVPALIDAVRRLRADAWVPCSPAWIAANPGQCPTAPRAAGPEGVSHLHPAVLGEDVVDEMAASLARDGFGADELADMLAPGVTDGEAAEPTLLRWGLDDVMYGDDDSTIVMLSGPDREPYWLELDVERAASLRQSLAGPDGEPGRALTASEYNTAWHAVEGAAGAEGADPGTVLHAVLDRLGIAWQDAAYPATTEGSAAPATEEPAEACGKCKRPFDPTAQWDGRHRYAETPYCRRCVGLCRDNEIADHRCVICA